MNNRIQPRIARGGKKKKIKEGDGEKSAEAVRIDQSIMVCLFLSFSFSLITMVDSDIIPSLLSLSLVFNSARRG